MRDQTIKADAGKRRLSLVPGQINYDIAEVREYGIEKYGDTDSWLRVEIERYKDAAYRHWLAYLEDPDSVDPESGIKHYKHWACNTDEIIEKYKRKTCEHEWLVQVSECTETVAVLKCKKCGKKQKRLNEVSHG